MCKSQHIHKTEKQEEEGIKNMQIRMFLRRIFLGLESKIRYFTQSTNVFAWKKKKSPLQAHLKVIIMVVRFIRILS